MSMQKLLILSERPDVLLAGPNELSVRQPGARTRNRDVTETRPDASATGAASPRLIPKGMKTGRHGSRRRERLVAQNGGRPASAKTRSGGLKKTAKAAKLGGKSDAVCVKRKKRLRPLRLSPRRRRRLAGQPDANVESLVKSMHPKTTLSAGADVRPEGQLE